MPYRLFSQGLIFFTTILSLSACQSEEPALQTAVQSEVMELLAPWDRDNAPGVAVAIMLDGETVLSEGAGFSNLEHAIPISSKSVFHIASVSKQFTAFSVLMLASEGRLSLDDDVRAHLPELRYAGEKITIRDLLDHTSGFRDEASLLPMAGWLEDDAVTIDQVTRLVWRQTGLNFEPGEAFEYNNTNYFLLAKIVERLSGVSFSDFVKSRIFDPLGMTDSRVHQDRSALALHRVDSYFPSGDSFAKANLNSEVIGSTGIQTTTEDLLKWAHNFETKKVGAPAAFDLMEERKILPDGSPAVFARGHESRYYKGLSTWSHGGRIGGYRSFLLRIPSEKFAVSILSNAADFDTAKIAFAIADAVLRERDSFEEPPIEEWKAATSQELERITGAYELYEGVVFTFTTDGQKLFFTPPNTAQKIELPQIGTRRFSLNPTTDVAIEFPPVDEGAAQSMSYVIGLHGALKATRIELEPFEGEGVDIQAFSGRYYSDELLSQYAFEVKDGRLTASHVRLGSIELIAHQPDVFVADAQAIQNVEFVRDAAGEIIGCRISGGLAKHVWFSRQS